MNSQDTLRTLTVNGQEYTYYSLRAVQAHGLTQLERLPFSIRVLLENALRRCDGLAVTEQDVLHLAAWQPAAAERPSMRFFPARVLMQDLSGVPVLNDLASMRAALARLGGDPRRINPAVPVDLVIDHSIQVDVSGTPDAMQRNSQIEFQRNRERYQFLHWAQHSFDHLRIVPPATGIVHQVNLEYLAPVVTTREEAGLRLAFPDSVVGTDSHTTMINGLGVVGWGVGGIEAISAMLDQPVDMLIPDVVGVRLSGKLPEGTTPTDLTLTLVQLLRKHGVVEKFVEFCGPALDTLSLAERAMIANMAPEYGATLGFFPVDAQTLAYLRLTGRSAEQVALVEAYCRAQGLLRESDAPEPRFTSLLELDLSTVQPALAGPKRPQDRLGLGQMQAGFRQALGKARSEGGYGLSAAELDNRAELRLNGQTLELRHGALAIAAITSCTNTSDPFVMLSAGLLAQKALARGLRVRPGIKTSLAPGSRVVTAYLESAGLLDALAGLGFHLVGYGCTTCIGNTGPLLPEVQQAITAQHLVAAAVLSGNRNFEGRVSPYTQANYLASPPLVVAYALAGTVDIDLTRDPLGLDPAGQPVYLREVWPSNAEVQAAIQAHVQPELFQRSYAEVFNGSAEWNAIQSGADSLYSWSPDSTYLKEPPFFINLQSQPPAPQPLRGARALLFLGDSVTTDMISPAGEILPRSAAGAYLLGREVMREDFNTFGSRRGHNAVLTRATFGNPRLKNRLLPGVEGSLTLHLPSGETLNVFDAAARYQAEGTPLVVLAGKEYGTGSSRDWAAKGPLLLGVRAVLAESFERIHRSNLVGMGVLPLQFLPGESAAGLGLTGRETFDLGGLEALQPGKLLEVTAHSEQGGELRFRVRCRVDTALELEYYRHGGIMQRVLREKAAPAKA